ncbi:MAG: hypothetical protein JXA67_15925, partial [Micromonosporaceae bacterium]|nr:hypothetical protein [Micromonosporaceae bacterium]
CYPVTARDTVRSRWAIPRRDIVAMLLEMPLENSGKGVAVFEIESAMAGSDLDLVARDHGAVTRARQSLDEALNAVKPALAKVTEAVREMAPDELEIGFGLKITGESGVIIAKGTSEVNFTVRLVWKQA